MVPAKLQETPSTALIPAPAGGFGKVLNSLHGLQQRLDDFSVEEVIRAAATSEGLIGQLSFLQVKLAGAVALKKALSDAHRWAADEIPAPDSALVALSSLEKYSTLNAILAIGNQLREAVLACPVIAPKSESVDPLALRSDASEAQSTPTSKSSQATSIAPTADRDSHRKSTDAKSNPMPPWPKSKAEPAAKPSSARGKGEFDQRLLDDLIKTYGDFASSPTSRAPIKTSTLAAVNVKTKAERIDTPAPITALTVINPDPVKPSEATNTVAGSVKSSPAEIIPILEAEPAKASGDNTKSLTKQGDIDRQLKRIIKDYGEYDLYPRNNSLNVKVAGMVAFALLGLVLALFYLFKAPASITTAPANSIPGGLNQPSGEATNHGKEKK